MAVTDGKPVSDLDRRIVFFDIDGTLVPATSSGSFLAQRLGHREKLDAAEAAYAAGTLSNDEVCHLDARGWAGHRRDAVRNWLTKLPLIDGIAETLSWCRDQAIEPYLATLAWSEVGDHLAQRFGFEGYCGPTLGLVDGIYTGQVECTFDEYQKRDFALRIAAERDVTLARCAAVGDSRSDLPLFEAVGFSVAVNAGPAARSAATTAVDSADLRAIIPALETWLAAGI